MKLPGPRLSQSLLRPGELIVTREPRWVITLLGSCVAVTMFNARFRLAGICHAMLPEPHGGGLPGASPDECFRYISYAIPAMAGRFAQFGLRPEEVEVKMFGGGNVIDMGGDPHDDRSIGDENVALARELLHANRFQIRSESVGGDRGRKILFNTENGRVLHKLLSRRTKKHE
jgi:chemotaxis protein CheD